MRLHDSQPHGIFTMICVILMFSFNLAQLHALTAHFFIIIKSITYRQHDNFNINSEKVLS